LSLKPAEQEQIYDCQTAKEAWTHLQEVYKGKGMHRLLSLLKQLSTAQLEKYAASPPGSNTIKDYIRSMIQTADEIAAIGYKLDRPVVIAFILNGLPETFRYLVVNLESQVDTISFQDLQARLLDEDKRI
jgi:gag-polypeptide of LTR copia-type